MDQTILCYQVRQENLPRSRQGRGSKEIYRLGLGVALILQEPASPVEITIKELANPLFSLTAETAEVAEKVIVIFHYRTVGYISTSLTVCLY
jgi:hypothetical protein